MPRSSERAKLTLQIVLQRQACALQQTLDLQHIGYEVVEQPGPLTLRIAATAWQPIRALAAEGGFSRPDFFCQADTADTDPFRIFWSARMPGNRL